MLNTSLLLSVDIFSGTGNRLIVSIRRSVTEAELVVIGKKLHGNLATGSGTEILPSTGVVFYGTFINQVVFPEVFDSCEMAGGFLYQVDSSSEEGVFVRRYRLE